MFNCQVLRKKIYFTKETLPNMITQFKHKPNSNKAIFPDNFQPDFTPIKEALASNLKNL